MARLIYSRDSTALHIRLAKRHIRLCGRVPGCEKFATAIKQPVQWLTNKEAELARATATMEEAYDAVVLCDRQLDNKVRTTFERVKQFDREKMTRMLDLLFPSHGYSDIITKSLSEEPQEVNKLLGILETMPEDHELRVQLAAPLRQLMEASVQAWEAYQEALKQRDTVKAAEEHERRSVRQQYEHNWLDARKQFGKFIADSIFPQYGNSTEP